MSRTHVKLPVGEKPGWELDDSGDEAPVSLGLKSVAESSVILLSLKQSRDKWLSSTFPKFSSKARGGKPAEIVQLPHTIQNRGRCDIEIGPHIFPDTAIFEVHYLPPQPSTPASTVKPAYLYQPHSMSGGSWQATTPYGGGTQYHIYGQQSPQQKMSTPDPISQPSSKPLLSSLTSSVSITPTLISQVNSAASSNPTLANLLQLAAAGKANPDQLKTLGLLIQSLANTSSDLNGASSSSFPPQKAPYGASFAQKEVQTQMAIASTQPLPRNTPYMYLPPVREFDIIFEFQETMSERWIFPRGPVVCERVPSTWTADAACDILISTRVPFPKFNLINTNATEKKETPTDDIPPQLVTFRLKSAPIAVWDTINRWIGRDELVSKNCKVLEDLTDPARSFLGHQLPQGSLLTQVQNVSAAKPPFNTRPIKPVQGSVVKPKRKASRKPAPDTNARTPATSAAQKRKRQAQTKTGSAVSQIACFTCGQVDVPLIMGGRFCRPCAEAGKGAFEVPQANGSRTYPHKSLTSITIPAAVRPTPDSIKVPSSATQGNPSPPEPPVT